MKKKRQPPQNEAITAWRYWKVKNVAPQGAPPVYALFSLTQDTQWPERQALEAEKCTCRLETTLGRITMNMPDPLWDFLLLLTFLSIIVLLIPFVVLLLLSLPIMCLLEKFGLRRAYQPPPPHDPPHPRGKCGIYGTKELSAAEHEFYRLRDVGYTKTSEAEAFAFGRVSLWGRMRFGTKGWRAQFAYPYDLSVVGGTQEMVSGLRNRYAVDVTLVSEKEHDGPRVRGVPAL